MYGIWQAASGLQNHLLAWSCAEGSPSRAVGLLDFRGGTISRHSRNHLQRHPLQEPDLHLLCKKLLSFFNIRLHACADVA
mmetsp:Transcript_87399/g.271544  ORF Transcript_87399/g.271544 Transcript_87399/m.271544 type:complete len:80 (+) Transcript_87399:38-277(+)